ncbi:NAD(P)-dependent oxidoreductase [Actinopolymorpha sp. B17G11]|uniref:NAD(P)-dependent oxidoreductase n=1 Tax=Actinopolymorpha sp. B17G11 TaxID=3160861 RepID=UPI0032E4F05E
MTAPVLGESARDVLVSHASFDGHWPWVAEAFRLEWPPGQCPLECVRLDVDDARPVHEAIRDPASVHRLVVLGAPFTPESVEAFAGLREAALLDAYGENAEPAELLRARGVEVHRHESEGFWGQSVAEFGLALTLCGLRRIPQLHHEMLTDLAPWDYSPPGGVPRPGARGGQYGDDPRFTAGTVAGARVRVVGAGNIASRYAGFVSALGADVAAWDPYATEPCFHRSGARREHHLDRLVRDAEIFVPMVPLLPSTEGLVTADHIDALPAGCLVVLVTRALICDMAAIRRRVLADEIALAADVWDVEPLPLSDPLLGRHNVVHTPHNAGRTKQANEAFARAILAKFR